MRKIDLTQQELNPCDEIILENNKLNFAWECWFDVDAYFGTFTNFDTDNWVNFLTIKLKLNAYDSDMLLHDINNLRGNEWLEVLLEEGIDANIVEQFEMFLNGDSENTWINFYTEYDAEKDDITAYYVIDSPSQNKSIDWELTPNEKLFLRKKMSEECKSQIRNKNWDNVENVLFDSYQFLNKLYS